MLNYHIEPENKPSTDRKLQSVILYHYQQSQYHIKLASMMFDHKQFYCCIILCDWALTSIIKALYIQENHTLCVPSNITMNEILPLVHKDSTLGLDNALFIGTVKYLSSLEDIMEFRSMDRIHTGQLLARSKETLNQLAQRLNDKSFTLDSQPLSR
ncbi:hypothetical protein D3C74_155220 [compost metagenome]